MAVCNGKNTELLSRNGKDLRHRFPAMLSALAAAIPNGSVVDGELVALDPSGQPNFSLLQNAATSGASFVFFALMFWSLRGWISLASRSLSDATDSAVRSDRMNTFSSPKVSRSPPSKCLRWFEVTVWRGLSPSGFPYRR